jgi:hypothetical protein
MSDHLCELISLLKRHYLYFQRGIDEAFTDFYSFYADRVSDPLSPRYLGIIMNVVGINSIHRKVDNRVCRWYRISFDDLHTTLIRISDTIQMQITI